MRFSEPAPAKLNLALHVRGKLPDGRHALETIFAFCVDGDRIEVEDGEVLTLTATGPLPPIAPDVRPIIPHDHIVARIAPFAQTCPLRPVTGE